MHLDLRIGPGRRPKPIFASVTRELTEVDLRLLSVERGITPPELKRVSSRHHALARALASGMGEGEAAALVGYERSRVSILKNSPAFRELLDLYTRERDAQFTQFHALLAGIATDAALELQNRLEDAPDKLSAGQLMDILKLGADRTGYGPSSKQEVQVNVNLAERLEAARKRALEARGIIDITPQE